MPLPSRRTKAIWRCPNWAAPDLLDAPRVAKAVVQRAKSILAANSSFFSATAQNQRIRGPELYERLIHVLVETMLEPMEGACLTVTEAYNAFCQLSQQRGLGMLKRSMFRELMRD